MQGEGYRDAPHKQPERWSMPAHASVRLTNCMSTSLSLASNVLWILVHGKGKAKPVLSLRGAISL